MTKWLLAVIVAALGAFPALAQAQDLALKRVMLSSGGLGYFEYEATVEGDGTLKLTVPLDQVDDVLKSLVVYDDKGGIGGLSLPGKEPLSQVFKDMPFDQNALETPGGLLSALKGAQITVGGSRTISGRIMSVEEEPVPLPDGKTGGKRTRVTVLTENGLQQFVLEDAQNLQFADAGVRDKVGQALLAIQANRAKGTRTLDLSTRGQGKRAVRVAYIVSAPVWKPSYRLTLPADSAAPKAVLQGWATVENLSGQDWKDIELTLVSGRPVAFHQALYDAYFVTRPEVPVEVAGRLMPGVDRGAVEFRNNAVAEAPSQLPVPRRAASPFDGQQRQESELKTASSAPAPPPPMASAAEQFDATEAATQVVFKFPKPVSVGNGRTLSIPILDRQMPAQRLALYQAGAAGRNPLAAVRLGNDGDTGLPPGLLTIYERDKAGNVSYVGDARLSGFPVGETRLLAYAVDEKITIEREPAQTSNVANGTIADSVLRFARVVRQSMTYRVRGPAKEPRQLIIVQPRLAGWALVKPEAKGVEVSEGNYRIPFQLPGGDQTQIVEVVQEQTLQQEVRLLDTNIEQIKVFAQAKEFDAKTREALTKVVKLQGSVAEAERGAAKLDADRQRIVQEQARLRENLGRVPANSDLQRRYLAALDRQETDLEGLAKQRAEAEKSIDAARQALRAFVSQLG